MSLRLSISEAEERKLISKAEAVALRKKQRSGRRAMPDAVQSGRRPGLSKTTSAAAPPYSPISGVTPQQKLWRALVQEYSHLVKSGDLRWELSGVVPGRKYSLDIAFLDLKVGLELDGWEWHGKNLQNFKRDRQKDRLLLLNGWRVLRFYASEVNDELDTVLDVVGQARALVASEKTGGRVSA